MLNLYRRHLKTCPHRKKGQTYTKCSCPIWRYGELHGRTVRRSTGLREWKRGVKRIESEKQNRNTLTPPTLAAAVDSYLGDCTARNLKESTRDNYGTTLGYLKAFCGGRGIADIDQIDLAALTDFRASRKVESSTSRKELETLRAFCAFAENRRWIAENYAKQLKAPSEDSPPTLPFERDEIAKILDACGKLEDGNPNTRGEVLQIYNSFAL